MSTGIKCDKSCYEAFEELRLLKKHRYILFHIYNNQEIKVLHRAAREANYDDFMQDLITAMNAGEGRYAVYDFELEGKVPTMVFILWVPSSLDVKVRMIYAASKSALKAKLVGVKHEVEANDLEEIAEEELFKKVR
ncbi:Cofilin/actin-depolymerizing factor [Schistosoma japonicum]|uniref:Cofilin/actin-depolymerizing factor n=3 Tax=Schistosoma japonicum TaxID=6182 RepID=C1LMR7_SCHJA|nr:Cofilin/actin-depolymerizing factor [Schistosoma japonicum]CAX75993.1 putative Cofilin-1 [Schistosoma japonicum]CAX75995.1 putative Cofilin-1 [Schistosoma japonicum]